MADDLRSRYVEHSEFLEQLAQLLEQETKQALNGLAHIDRVYFRVKSANSFVAKALDPTTQPPYKDALVEIEDQVAGRIIVFLRDDLDLVAKRLRGTFTTVERTHERPARDEEFGYESDHHIYIIPPHLRPDDWNQYDDLPNTFELQVRTIFMHAYAEPQHNIAYKAASELPRHIRRELAWIAASAWGADEAYMRVWRWHNKKAGKNGTDH